MKRTATVSGLFLLIFVMTGGLAFGQHWQHDGNQGEYHTLVVQSVTINGTAVEADDEIAVFTPGGDLGGTIVVTIDDNSPPFSFSSWGATGIPFNEAGFENGDAFTFKIWDNSANEELVAVSSPTGLTYAGDDFGGDPLFFSLYVGPEIDISQGDQSHAFGDVNLDTGVEWTFTISNIGSEALQVSSVASDLGVYTTNFDNDNGVSVGAGATYDVVVTFTPTAEQAYNGTLTITSDDVDENEVTVTLTGAGVSDGEPDISLSTANNNYGEVIIGDNSSFTLTLSNEGAVELNVSSVTSDNNVFTSNFDNDNGAVIGAGGGLNVSVTFTPAAAQEYNGTLTIASDDPDEAETTVSLSGTGVQGPHFEFTTTNVSHNVVVNEALLDGSSLVAGDEIGVFTPGGVCAGAVILENAQEGINRPLDINAVEFPLGLTAYGAEGQNPGFSAGDALTFKYWDDSAETEYTVTALYDSGPETWESDGFTNVRLNGQSEAAPEIEIDEDDLSHAFGEVLVDNSSEWTFDILNIGGAEMTITSIASDLGAYTTDVDDNTVIQSNQTLTVTVTFAPTAGQAYNGTLTVNSDDDNEGAIEITVTGIGVEPALSEVGAVGTPANLARKVDVSGNYAYIADTEGGLAILDISDPTDPTNVGQFNTPGSSYGVTYSDGHAYISDVAGGLRIYDVSDPTDPDEVGVYDSPDHGRNSYILGNTAYLADGDGGLRIVDVTDVTDPTLIGTYDIGSYSYDVTVQGDLAYVSSTSGLSIIDISDPTNPDLVGSAQIDGESLGLVKSGNYVYIASFGPGLLIFDVRDPTDPTSVGSYEINAAYSVEISGDYLMLANGGHGLRLLDVSDPSNPTSVDLIGVPDEALGVDGYGEYIYVASNSGGLRVMDASDYPMPNMSYDPAAIAFDDTDVRADAATQTLTVTNNGDGPLTITAFAYGSGFSTTFGDPVTIQPEGTTEITVAFDPSEAQEYSGTLRIFSNDDDVRMNEIALTGTGTSSAEIQTTVSIAFGDVEINQQGEATLTIENIGGTDLTIQDIVSDNEVFTVEFDRLTPQNDWEFSETNQTMSFVVTDATIGGDQLVTDDYVGVFTEGGICAGFSQLTEDGFDVGVTAYRDDPNTGGVVEGFGDGDAVLWRIWDTDAGEEYDATADYSNGEGVFASDGFATLSLSTAQPENPAPLLVNVNEPIAPGESMEVFIYFNPTAVQDYEGTLTIGSDDAYNEEVTVAVTGSGIDLPPDITLDPTTLNFGSLYVGEQTSDLTFTITNDGSRDLVVESIAVEGEGFTINNNGDFTLAEDENQTVTVTFEPGTAGDFNGTVTVTSDDPDEGEETVTLTGTGANFPIVRLDPEAFDFGDVVHGESSEQTLTIHNDGEEPLNITNISSDNGAYTVNFDPDQEVREFDWSFVETQTNMSLLVNDATVEGNQLVDTDYIGVFTANGVCAGYTQIGGNANFNDGVGITVWQDDNGTEEEDGFSVGATLNYRLWDTDAGREYTATADYTQGNGEFQAEALNVLTLESNGEINAGGDSVVEAGGSTEYTVTFLPDAVQQYDGTLTVETNDPFNGEETASLTGNGVNTPAEITVDPTSLDFGTLYATQDTDDLTFTISNEGELDLTVGSITVAGDGYSADSEGDFTLEPNAEQVITVTFAPQDEGTFNGTVTITSDDADEAEVVVNLTGEGAWYPIVRLDPEAFDFGDVVHGESSEQTLTIHNDGEEPLNITNISSDNGAFTVNFDADQEVRAFDWSFTENQSNLSLLVNDATIEGNQLVDTDYIGVFTANGICAGYTQISDEANFDGGVGLTVWQDDNGTEEEDGFALGAPLNYRLWDTDAGREYTATADYTDGDGVFEVNAVFVLTLESDSEINAGGDSVVEAGGSTEYSVTFSPDAVQQYDGTLTVETNDPFNGEETASLTGNGVNFPADISVDPTSLDFGTLYATQETVDLTFTITNDGELDLTVGSITVAGDGYSADSEGDFTLEPNAEQVITVTFAPEDAGTFNGTVTIASDDADEAEVVVNLTGEGAWYPIVRLDPEAFDFGDVVHGQSSQQTLTIHNDGEEPLTINDITTDNGIFTVNFDPNGGEQEIRQFDWDFTETQSNMSLLVNDATVDGNQLVDGDYIGAFTQNGLCAGFTQIGGNANFNDGVGITVWADDNGTEPVDGFTTNETVAYRLWDTEAGREYSATPNYNQGDGQFEVDALMVLTLTSDEEINAQNQGGDDVVEAGGSTEFTVTFSPTAVQEYSGTLTVDTNDPFNGEETASLAGNGVNFPAEITVAPTSLDFGTLYATQQTEELTFTITNDGELDLTVGSITVAGDGYSADSEGDFTLEPNAEQVITVTFAPEDAGTFNGTVTIASNDADEAEVVVNLTGDGAWYPIVRLDPEAFDFGDVVHGESSQQMLTIHNDGEEPLTISDITTDNGVFSVNFDPNGGEQEIRQFDWDFSEAQANMSLLVNDATIEGTQLADGDYIGVFTSNGICAGFTELGGEANFNDGVGITAWQDDNGTEPVEGFTSGATVNYRLWDSDAGREYSATPDYTQGDGEFVADGLFVLTLSSDEEINVQNQGGDDVVEAGGSTEFTVTFSPTAVQEYSGTLTVDTDDPFNGAETAGLTGNGVNSPADITVAPTSLDFGTLYATQETEQLTFTVTNDGELDLTVSFVGVEGAGYSIDIENGFTLASGEYQEITVTFSPQDDGQFDGTITVESDDEDEAEVTVDLSGFGRWYPIIRLDPESFDFGDVIHGSSSEMTLTIHNDGEETLNISDIASDAGVFTTNFNIGGGDDVMQFGWEFSETQSNMSFIVNDARVSGEQLVDSDYIGAFTTGGICAGYTQIGGNENFEGGVGVTAWQDDNGTQEVEGFVVNETVNWRLWDTDAGREYTATASYSQGNGQFAVDALSVLTLSAQGGGDEDIEPGGATQFTVTFSPEAVQEYNGTLTVTSSDPFNGDVTADLTGNGVNSPADIAVSPTTLNFSTLYATQETEELTFTITNNGELDLTITAVTTTGDGFSDDVDDGFTLAEGEEQVVTVMFAPEDAGAFDGTVTIASNDPDEGEVTVNLSGDGQWYPIARIEEEVYDFGDVVHGESGEMTLVIHNDGQEPLSLADIATDNNVFTVNFNPDGGGDQEIRQFDWDFTETQSNMSLIVNNAVIGEAQLADGDYIGAFTGNGVCAGFTQIGGNENFEGGVGIAIWQDDNGTEEEDGFAIGESINYRLWDTETGREYTATSNYQQGDGDFEVDALFVLTLESDEEINVQNGGGDDVVEAGGSTEFTITFSPEAVQEYSGTLTVTTDDPFNEEVTAGLLGNGVNTPPDIAVDPTDLDFGTLYATQQSGELTFTITNDGEDDLVITSVTTTGDGFVDDIDDGFTLTEGEEQVVTVTFAPEDAGAFDGTVTIASNDPDEGEVTVNLSGDGQWYPIARIEEEVYDFGDVVHGESGEMTLVIHNDGQEPLSLTDIATDNNVFTVNFNPDGGGDQEIRQFDWDFTETQSNMSLIVNDAVIGEAQLVDGDYIGAFTGNGVCAGFTQIGGNENFEGGVGIAVWQDDNGTQEEDGFTIGETVNYRLWDTEAGREYTATPSYQQGNGNFEVDALFVLTLESDEEINVQNGGGDDVVEAGGSTEFTITFSPEAVQEYSGTLTVTTDDPFNEEVTAGLLGNGVNTPPDITVDPTDLDFGSLYATQQSGELTFTITNDGEDDLVITSITTTGDGFSDDIDDGFTLTEGEEQVVTVTFAPEDAGAFDGTVTIASNDPDEDEVAINLSGDGQWYPIARIEEEVYDFGDVVHGESGEMTLVIHNDGQEPLSIADIATDNDAFTVNFNPDGGGDQEIRQFDWDFVETQANMSLIVNDAVVGQEQLVEGDYIGVFTSNGICAGFTEISQNENFEGGVGIAVWQDDNGTEEEDGFTIGETLNYRLWDADAGREYTATPSYQQGDGDFEVDALFVLTLESDEEINIQNGGGDDVVEPGSSTEFTITFNPEAVQEYSGTLTVTTDDPFNEEVTAGLFGNGIEIPREITVDPVVIDFGHIYAGQTDEMIFTVTNDGEVELTVSSITVNDEAFSVDNGEGFVLEGGASQDVTVTFAPDEAIEYSGTVTVASDDPDEAEVTVDVSGVGDAFPIIRLEPDPIDFGEVIQNEEGQQTLTIFNDGDVDLNLNDITSNSEFFTVNFNPEQDQEVREFDWNFTETQANMSLIVNDAVIGEDQLVEGDYVGVFTGDGLCAGYTQLNQDENFEGGLGIAVWQNDNQTQEVDGFAIGETLNYRLWDTDAGREYTATPSYQQGDGEFEPDGLMILTLEAADEIGGGGGGAATIEPGGSTEFTVYFNPTEVQEYTGVLTVDSDDPFNGEATVDLIGEGIFSPPEIAVDPTDLDFGTLYATQETSDLTFTVTNNGQIELEVTSLTVGDGPFSITNEDGFTLEQGEEQVVTVTFAPENADQFDGTVTIASNDPDNAEVTVTLTGEGVWYPIITTDNDVLDYGEVVVGTQTDLVLTITNEGEVTLQLNDIFTEDEGFSVEFGGEPEVLDFDWDFVETDGNMSLIINDGQIGGEEMVNGDYIGVFTPGGVCAGYQILDEENNFADGVGIAAWKDDGETEEVDGFTAGQTINFRLWDSEAGVEYAADAEYQLGNGEWSQDALYVVSSLQSTRVLRGGGGGPADSIEPGASIELPVTFAPEEIRDYEGTLTIQSNDPFNDEILVDLVGVSINSPPEIILNRTSLNFGTLYATTETGELTISIRNNGQLPLDVASIVLDGDDAFSIDNEGDFTLEENETDQVIVTFAPEDAGQFGGTVTISSNDPDDGEVVVTLSGEAIWYPIIRLEPEDVIDFGEVPINRNGAELYLTVHNDGQEPLTISDMYRENSVFSIDWDLGGGEPIEFDWDFTETDNNMSLIVESATIGGETMVEGDYIGVFTPDGICAGYTEIDVDGFAVGIAAWGDDGNTENIVEGFVANEELIYRLWDTDANREYEGVPSYSQGDATYSPDALSILDLESGRVLRRGGEGGGDDEPGEFDWEFSESDNNLSLIIDDATIGGETLVEGDYVGVFTPDGICAGFVQVDADGFSVGTAAWGDDGNTEEVVEGFAAGEELNYRLWQTEMGREYAAEPNYDLGDGIYEADALFVLTLASTGRLAPLNVAEEVIQPDGSMRFLVSFNPEDVGEYDGLLTVVSDDPFNPMASVDLYGIGALTDPEIIVNPDALGFGALYATQESGDLTITVQNNGQVALEVSNISFDGDDAFSIDNEGGFTLEEGESEQVTVTFAPEDAGQFSGTVTISSNDPDDEEYVVTVSGEGVWYPIIRLEPEDVIDFGEVPINRGGAELYLTVHNDGQEPLTISDMYRENSVFSIEWNVGGGGPIEFDWEFTETDNNMSLIIDAVDNEGGFSLEENETVEITVTFAPEDAGQFDGTVTVVSNDPDGDVVVNLTGEGRWYPVVRLEPDDVMDFGEVPILRDAGELTLTVHNDGQLPLTLSEMFVDDLPFEVEFVIEQREFDWEFSESDNNLSLIIDGATIGGESLVEGDYVGVFTPDGICAGYVRIDGDGFSVGMAAWGDDGNTEDVVEGFVADERLHYRLWDDEASREYAAEAAYDLGDGIYAADALFVLTLEDAGRVSPVNVAEEVIEAGGSMEFLVTFTPEQVGDYDGLLTVVSDDPFNEEVTLDLFGVGILVEPEIVVDPLEMDFGSLYATRGTSDITFTITNTGQLALEVDEIVLEGEGYSIDNEGNFDVEENESVEITVTFAPQSAGLFEGTVTIPSNDPEGDEVITLTGRGVRGVLVHEDDDPDFGEVPAGGVGQFPVVFKNDGDADLTIEDIEFSDDAFTLDDPDQRLHFEFVETDNSMLITVATATLDNESLVAGDEIAVFTSEGLCAGAIMLMDQDGEILPVDLTAWGDDDNNQEVEGFGDQEEIAFRIWDDDASEEYSATAEYISGEGIYVADETAEVNLTAVSVEPREFDWEFTETDNNLSLIVNDATIGGESLVEGDYVGVFTPDGICAGYVQVDGDGFSVGMAAWGDDRNTEDVVEGFVADEELSYRLWQTASGTEYDASPDYQLGDGIYETDALFVLTLEGVEDGRLLPMLDEPIVLAPDEEIEFIVFFNPDQKGEYEGQMIIHNDDIDNPEFEVQLRGIGANNQPVIVAPTEEISFEVEVDEDQELTVEFEATDRDDIDELSWRVAENGDLPDGWALNDNDDRTAAFVWTPGFEDSGEYSPLIVVDDGDEGADSIRLVITVNHINRAPEWVDVPEREEDVEDALLTFDVLGDDPDVEDADAMRITMESEDLPDEAGFEDNFDGTGTFAWTPTFDDEGEYSATFIITDGVLSATAEVSIVITHVNREPVVVAPMDDLNFDEDSETVQIADLMEVFSDPDGDELRFAVELNENLIPTIVDSVLSITPVENYNGVSDVIITASDGQEEVRMAMRVNLGQNEFVNNGPVRLAQGLAAVRHGIVDDPRRDLDVDDAFTVTVNPVNDEPTITQAIGDQEGLEAELLTFDLTAADVDLGDDDPDVLTWSIQDGRNLPDGWEIVNDDGAGNAVFEWTPGNRDAGDYDVTFVVTDRGGEAAEEAITITITNPPPEVVSPIDDVNIDEDELDEPLVIADLNDVFSDPDGDELIFSYNEGDIPNELGMSLVDGLLSIDPEEHYNLEDGIEVTVTADDSEQQRIVRLALNFREARRVGAVNRIAAGLTSTTTVDQQEYLPQRDDAIDNDFSIVINPVNDAPFIVAPDDNEQFEVVEMDELRIDLSADDFDLTREGDVLTWSISDEGGLPQDGDWAIVDDDGEGNATFVWTPDFDDAPDSPYTPTFMVSDEGGLTAEVSVEITVTESNRPPIIVDGNGDPEEDSVPVDATENVEFVYNFNAIDPDEDALAWGDAPFNLGGLPEGEFQFDDNGDGTATFTWTPDFDAAGEYRPVFRVTDDGNPNASDDLELVITVGETNRAPVIVDENGQAEADTVDVVTLEAVEFVYNFEADDIDNHGLSWEVVDQGGLPDGEFNLTDNGDGTAEFTWTPVNDAAGEYMPTFRVTDDFADEPLFDDLTLNMAVVNPAPEVANAIADIDIDEDPDGEQEIEADLNNVFADPDADALTFDFDPDAMPPAGLNMQIDGDRLFYDPDPNFNVPGGVLIGVVATDAQDSTVINSFTLVINPINDAPARGEGQDGFDLVSPADGSEIDREDNEVTFEWEEAVDVDNDDVNYTLFFHVFFEYEPDGVEVDTSFEETGIDQNSFNLENIDDILRDHGIFYHHPVSVDVDWWVKAYDGIDSTESNQRWVVTLPVPTAVEGEEEILPTEYSLSQNYPNPFNPSTYIDFAIPKPSDVRITVWDVSGRMVQVIADGNMPVGNHTIRWDANGVSTGIYLFMLETEGVRIVRKGALVR